MTLKWTENHKKMTRKTGSKPEINRKTAKNTKKLLSLAHTFGSILLLNDLTRLKWDVLLNSGLSFLKLFSTLFLNQLENVLAQFQLPRRSNEFNTPTQKPAYTSTHISPDWPSALSAWVAWAKKKEFSLIKPVFLS